MSRRMAWGTVALAGALAATLGAGVAGASPAPEPVGGHEPGMAMFEGNLVDLRKGWPREVRLCTVHGERDVRCYRSAEDAETRLSAESCGGNQFCLWAGPAYTGITVQIVTDETVDLANLNLRRNVSSWINNRSNAGFILANGRTHTVPLGENKPNGRGVGGQAEKVFG